MSSPAVRSEETVSDPPIASPSAERRGTVESARQAWIRKLIDLSRRNNLLYYRHLKTGTLDLSLADFNGMAALFSGETAAIAKLLPSGKDESVTNVARDIARRAQANAEEKGLQTLFVALGMATWAADDGGRPANAPVLLLPVSLEGKGTHSIVRTGAVQVNPVLLHVLDKEFGVKLKSDDLVAHLQRDEEAEKFDPAPVYRELQNRAADVPGFVVNTSTILGNFAFQKMAMVKDLEERANELAAHDLVAAIAGDKEARNGISTGQSDLDPKELDKVPPENEFIVLDADSSQQCAVANVLAGQSAVIHGPPGTGKSQTIANLIATLAATGKRVLFVAEKRAALEVVLRRLSEVGLGHLAIDLHGADLSPKRVMQQVAEALEKVRQSVPADADQIHQQLADRRSRLNAHVERLHAKRSPTGLSIYEMQGKLLRLDQPYTPKTRWRGEDLNRLTPDAAVRVHDLLAEAAGFESLFLRTDSSPWTGARLRDGASTQRAVDAAARADGQTFPAFKASLDAVMRDSGLRWPTSITLAGELMELVFEVQSMLERYNTDIYKQEHSALLRDLEKGKSGGLSGTWAWITSSAYRRARKLLLELRKAPAPVPKLYTELTEIKRQAEQWKSRAEGGSIPHPVDGIAAHKKNKDSFFPDLEIVAAALPHLQVRSLGVAEMGDLIRRLSTDTTTPHQLPKLTMIEESLDRAGAAKFVEEIREGKTESRFWPQLFDESWTASALDAAAEIDPEVRGFKGTTHSRFVEEFVRADEERIAIASERVRRAHGLHAIEAMNAHPDQQHLIKAEAAKAKRHLPLRKTFAQAAEVLTAVCPCWMASPLSVSQLLDGGKQYFDFVVFDEASQILPEDAVPSILRGKKIVVAGDNKQLPPTTFFAASDEDESAADEDVSAADGFESLLDMMIPFVKSCYLDWHYRSRDEMLINFSNYYIYQNRLVTFPGPGGPPAINHEEATYDAGADGQEDSPVREVRKVVDLVMRHAREHPDETLGVITMGVKHANRVQAALDSELERHPELEAFFDPNAQERFFVKNLERVQGDERDVVIITIGYGKDRAGNLPLRFGPLLSQGGRRRLNVAITRARRRVMLVSSFNHTDLDLSRVRTGSGVELLRNYLQYAATMGKRFGDEQLTTIPLNDFEAEVFDALTAQGLRLIPQMGASQFRIDMVAKHLSNPGRFVLAIECDGASYHSSYTARDRDRLRQQQLEKLGWRFHRIWSTDWFLRKEAEVERAMQAFKTAVEHADQHDLQGIRHGGNGEEKPNALAPLVEPVRSRAPKPGIPMRNSITQYSDDELVQLIRWVSSDGQLRTDDEIVDEMVSVLGFARRGARIEAAIKRAIQDCAPEGPG
jgi:very-short-patch-repair endonuclease